MVTRISNIMKINKTGTILDIDKIVYFAKDDDDDVFKIQFILNLNNGAVNVYECYESKESRNQWFSKISRELLGE